MRQTITSRHHETRYPIAETLWILAGIILVLTYGDALLVLALAFAVATMTMAWWIHRKVGVALKKQHGIGFGGPSEPSIEKPTPDAVNDGWRPPTSVVVGRTGYSMTMIRAFIFAAAAALAALFTLAAPAQAASINSSFDICAALRNGTSLATIESTLEARGYSATNAGALTGTSIRQHCPDQAAGVMAQIS